MTKQEQEVIRAVCMECGEESISNKDDETGVVHLEYMKCSICEKKTRHLVTLRFRVDSENSRQP